MATIRQMITMSADMQGRLAAAAAEEGTSMSEVVRRALKSRFDDVSGDPERTKILRQLLQGELHRLPQRLPPSVSEAADALKQIGWEGERALSRCTALAAENPEALTEDLITLALKVE